jgi:hypothetical protein
MIVVDVVAAAAAAAINITVAITITGHHPPAAGAEPLSRVPSPTAKKKPQRICAGFLQLPLKQYLKPLMILICSIGAPENSHRLPSIGSCMVNFGR